MKIVIFIFDRKGVHQGSWPVTERVADKIAQYLESIGWHWKVGEAVYVPNDVSFDGRF